MEFLNSLLYRLKSGVEVVMYWFEKTNIPKQFAAVDVAGLFTNPWFVVPFLVTISFLGFKKRIKTLIAVISFVGVWWFSGSRFYNSLVINGELQFQVVLFLFGGVLVVIIVFFCFGGIGANKRKWTAKLC